MARKPKFVATDSTGKTRLAEMRRKLDGRQKQLLNAFWQQFQQSGKWPITHEVHSQCGGKQAVRKRLQGLGGDVVFEVQDRSPGNRYELTIIGVLLTDCGEKYTELLVKYLEFLRGQFLKQPGRYDFADKDIAAAQGLSEVERDILGKLIPLTRLSDGYGYGPQGWNIRVPDLVEDLPPSGPLEGAFDSILFQRYKSDSPVFLEDRRKTSAARYYSLGEPTTVAELSSLPHGAVTVDALKRRYQVFVSSTYEDLKKERQSVIQALLERNVFPRGWNFFRQLV